VTEVGWHSYFVIEWGLGPLVTALVLMAVTSIDICCGCLLDMSPECPKENVIVRVVHNYIYIRLKKIVLLIMTIRLQLGV
jgi:hypothetical protein